MYRKAHFIPHITIGKLSDNDLFDQVIEETKEWDHSFKVTISEVYLEEIKEDGTSVIIRKVSL